MTGLFSGLTLQGLAVLLLLAGTAGLAVEFANPGVIVPGLAGAVCLVVALFLFESLPLWIAGLLLLALMGVVFWLAVRAARRRVTTGSEGLVGEEGRAETALCPGGTVFVHGEIWRAVADRPAGPGDRVRVAAVEGLTLKVAVLAKAGEISCPPGS
jgi:membrane-bound serine protease (ClpP class)